MATLETTNYLLALGTVALQLATLGLLFLFFLRERSELSGIVNLIHRWGLWLAFFATLFGSAMTLFYSEILGIPPCPLCWIQRAFLYPQVVLFGIALWKGSSRVFLVSILLSLLGLAVAVYHHALQMFPDALPCLAEGAVCAQRHIFEFGYITFPMMAVTLFAFLIALMLIVRPSARNTF